MAISKKLKIRDTGADVKELQQFLNANGFPVAAPGLPGSAGNETDYFGLATMAALKKFQASKGLDPVGEVGPKTLSLIQTIKPPELADKNGTPIVPKQTDFQYDEQNRKLWDSGYNALTGDRIRTGENSDLYDQWYSPIHSTKDKSEYINTPEYKKKYPNGTAPSGQVSNGNIPAMGPIDNHVANALGLIPTGGYDAPEGQGSVLKEGTPEWDAAYDKVQGMYYDVLNLMAEATTEQEKVFADYSWNQVKTAAEKALGIKLSNNAITAWDQLENLKTTMGGRGLAGSGMEAESIDDYLKKIRSQDDISRYDTKTTLLSKEDDYLRKWGTPEQVRELIMKDPERAKGLGLIPSESTKSAFSFDALKKQFPNQGDKTIQNYIDTMMDPYGNYRTTSFANLAAKKADNLKTKDSAVQAAVEAEALRKNLNAESDKGFTDIADDKLLPRPETTKTEPTPTYPGYGTTPGSIPTKVMGRGGPGVSWRPIDRQPATIPADNNPQKSKKQKQKQISKSLIYQYKNIA